MLLRSTEVQPLFNDLFLREPPPNELFDGNALTTLVVCGWVRLPGSLYSPSLDKSLQLHALGLSVSPVATHAPHHGGGTPSSFYMAPARTDPPPLLLFPPLEFRSPPPSARAPVALIVPMNLESAVTHPPRAAPSLPSPPMSPSYSRAPYLPKSQRPATHEGVGTPTLFYTRPGAYRPCWPDPDLLLYTPPLLASRAPDFLAATPCPVGLKCSGSSSVSALPSPNTGTWK